MLHRTAEKHKLDTTNLNLICRGRCLHRPVYFALLHIINLNAAPCPTVGGGVPDAPDGPCGKSHYGRYAKVPERSRPFPTEHFITCNQHLSCITGRPTNTPQTTYLCQLPTGNFLSLNVSRPKNKSPVPQRHQSAAERGIFL